jgi:predicted homoserine dehydrogenase-like protein
MIIVDSALRERDQAGDPVRVGLVGAGFMGRAICRQVLANVPGMDIVAISNRSVDAAERAYAEAGSEAPVRAQSQTQVDEAVASGRHVVTDDPALLCRAPGIEAILEVTGEVEFGAHVALEGFEHRKHLVAMNAELDATLGPILKVHADRAGVVFTNVDGDEPGVTMNLFRFVESIGMRPVLTGNLKGLLDPYRTPETQEGFARATGQGARMVTSFADGTKLSMELTIVANATGFGVGRRGGFGHQCEHVWDVLELFSQEQLLSGGLVDFLLGAEPKTGGAFVVGYDDDPSRRKYMEYFKMGPGPFYVFYRPWHLPHLEAPLTVARAALFGDAAVTPRGTPRCDVVTMAKRDLSAGETLDGIGGFTSYGAIDNADASRREGLLPMGLSEGCHLTRDVPRDQAVTYEDVEVPQGRLADKLRAEQEAHFPA